MFKPIRRKMRGDKCVAADGPNVGRAAYAGRVKVMSGASKLPTQSASASPSTVVSFGLIVAASGIAVQNGNDNRREDRRA